MAIKRPGKSTPEPESEPAAQEQQSRGKKRSGASKSFASQFDETKPGGGFMTVGTHKAYVVGLELEGELADEGEDQGKLTAKITYEGAEDEDEGVAGKTLSQWYQLATEDGELGKGIGFLKKDLNVLGYEDVGISDLEEVFASIVTERPKVVINVKQNGQYTNAYLQGLAEGE